MLRGWLFVGVLMVGWDKLWCRSCSCVWVSCVVGGFTFGFVVLYFVFGENVFDLKIGVWVGV